MKIDCPSWRDIGLHGAGRCVLKKFGGRPSYGTCGHCLGQPEQPANAIEAATTSSVTQSSLLVLLSDDQQRTIASRKAVCESCAHAKRLHKISVHCEGCGCAGLSLLTGTCPRNKWQDTWPDKATTRNGG